MNCPYCETYMRTTFSCPCTPDLLVCADCSDIQCHKCRKKLKLSPQPKRCEICSGNVPAHRAFMSKKYQVFCVQCCFKCYTNTLSQKRNMVSFETRHFSRTEVPLSQIKIFLQKFCIKCHKTIENDGKNQKSQQEQENGKKYYCETCYKQQTTQLNKIEPKDVIRQQQIHGPHTKNKEKNNGFMYQREQKHFQQKSSIHKQEEQRNCLVCNQVLSKTKMEFLALSNSDLSLCKHCQRMSRYSQQIYEKKKKIREVYSKQRGQEIKVKKNIHSPASLAGKQKEQGKEKKKENGRKNISESIILQKEAPHKPNLPQIPINEMDVKWIDDSQFVTCQICSIQVEKDCSAIMSEQKKPICRSCYSDLIQKLIKQMSQQNSQKKINKYFGQVNSRKDETKHKYSYLDDETQIKRTSHALSPLPTTKKDVKTHTNQNQRGLAASSYKYSKPLPSSQPTAVYKRKQFIQQSSIQIYPKIRQCPRCRTIKLMSDKYHSGGIIICLDCKQKQTKQIQQTRPVPLRYQ